MKIKKKTKLNFAEALKQLEFYQFCQVCNIFGVDIVERNSIKEMTQLAIEDNKELDLEKTKTRRDFDNMTNELIEKYNKYDRQTRRKFDKIMERVIKGNNRARAIEVDRLTRDYNEGVKNLDSIENGIIDSSTTVDSSATIDSSTTIDSSSTTTSTSTAAIASEA